MADREEHPEEEPSSMDGRHQEPSSSTRARPSARRRQVIGIAAGALLLALGAIAYLWHPWQGKEVEAQAHDLYTCPMHPQIVRERPGTCPICHMDLVPVVRGGGSASGSSGGDTAHEGATAMTLSDEGRITANVKTAVVEYRSIPSRLSVPAGVDFNEGTYKVVTARAAGRVERLFIDQTGQYVKRGAPLLEIYSPDLVAAQQDYLTARSAPPLELPSTIGGVSQEEIRGRRERWQRLVTSSRKRLEILGMTPSQIDALDRRGEVSYTTTLFSPLSGMVVRRAIAEGAYANVGTVLLEIVDLSSVWVIASVNENDAYGVRPGMEMAITGPAIGGEMIHGRVDFIYPTVEAESRTVRVRGVFPNPGMRLKPGMYLTATILVPGGESLVVPVSAAVRTGRRDLVYVEVARNTFEPREVRLGAMEGEYYRVESGNLSAGDRIVAEGGFLLDSERQLSGGNGAPGHPGTHPAGTTTTTPGLK
jgi:Cu(I)/Ag(I) efflux system membrane fusion protein